MAAQASRPPSSPSAERSRPIILLELVAPENDDRSFGGWSRFFTMLSESDAADVGFPRAVPAEG